MVVGLERQNGEGLVSYAPWPAVPLSKTIARQLLNKEHGYLRAESRQRF